MVEQMDLFNVLLEIKAIDKIRDNINHMSIFDTLQTTLCTIEKTARFWVVKTKDFEETFEDKDSCLQFIERGSRDGWNFVHEVYD